MRIISLLLLIIAFPPAGGTLVFKDRFEDRALFDVAPVAGQVTLPAGFPVALDDLTVETSLEAAVPVDALGAFSAPAGNAPQLAAAVGPSGLPLLLGWLGPGHTSLSLRTTAEVLLYFQLGASFSDPLLFRQIIELIPSEILALDALEGALATELATDPAALTIANEGIRQALADAVATVLGAAPQPKGVLVTPGSQSGIEVVREFQSIRLRNNLRRPGLAYIDRLACDLGQHTASAGDPACPAFTIAFDIPPIEGLSNLPPGVDDPGTVLASAGGLPVGYRPSQSARELLPLVEDASSVEYVATVIGAGLDPGVFDSLSDARKARAIDVNVAFVVRDLVLPVLLNILLPAEGELLDAVYDGAVGEGLVREVSDLLLADADFAQAVGQGEFADAAGIGISLLLTDPDLGAAVVERLLESLAIDAVPGQLPGYLGRIGAVIGGLGVVEGALEVIEQTVAGEAYASASAAARWQVTVTQVPAGLNFLRQQATCTENAIFQVVLAEPPGDVQLRYRYRIPPNVGALIDPAEPANTSTREIFSRNATVEFAPLPTIGAVLVPVSVAVEASDRGRTSPVGSAENVAIVEPPTVRLTPRLTSLAGGASIALTASVSDAKYNDENCTGGIRPLYAFAATDMVGTIDAPSGLADTREVVTYTAQQNAGGSDTVTVEAFLGGISLGQATAEVRVEATSTVVFGQLVIDSVPAEDNPPTERFCVNATVQAPLVPGATRYRLDAYGGFDPAFFGGRIVDTAPPFDNGFGITYTQDDRRFFLSGICGPGREENEAGLAARFGSGWIWQIEVTY